MLGCSCMMSKPIKFHTEPDELVLSLFDVSDALMRALDVASKNDDRPLCTKITDLLIRTATLIDSSKPRSL